MQSSFSKFIYGGKDKEFFKAHEVELSRQNGIIIGRFITVIALGYLAYAIYSMLSPTSAALRAVYLAGLAIFTVILVTYYLWARRSTKLERLYEYLVFGLIFCVLGYYNAIDTESFSVFIPVIIVVMFVVSAEPFHYTFVFGGICTAAYLIAVIQLKTGLPLVFDVVDCCVCFVMGVFLGQGLLRERLDAIAYGDAQTLLRNQELSDSLSRQASIVASMAEDFSFIGLIDTDKETMETVYAHDSVREYLSQIDMDGMGLDQLRESFAPMVYPADRERFLEASRSDVVLHNVWRNRTYKFEVRFGSAGHEKYYRLKFTEVSDDMGTIVVGLLDVDAQVRQQKAQAAEEYHLVIEGISGDHVFIEHVELDTGEETIYRESDAYRVLRADAEEDSFRARMGAYAERYVFEDDRERFLEETSPEAISEKLARGETVVVDHRALCSGELCWMQLKCFRHAEHRHHNCAIVGIRDVTEEHREQIRNREELERAKAAAEAANQAKTSFLFNMSHDIRTPMNAILGYTDIALRHREEPERVGDSLGKIKVASAHLLNLINDILEMSRIESGKLELAENPMDIREAVEGVAQMSRALAIPKSIDFTTFVGDIRNPYIYSDELHINEVLINLISNAVKYTPEGGKVEYRVEQLGDADDGMARFRFTVSDTGIGISEEFQQHLFESFTREEKSSVSQTEGAGLGLSIVKRIVEMAGGTIGVQSALGEGSVFTVEIPFKVMEESEAAIFCAEKDEIDAIEEYETLEGRVVLLVEDNEMNREIATEILEEVGIVVDAVEDGALAVRAVQEQGIDHYDCVLMDIQMPVMDGYEATKKIRELERGESLAIIALSANAFREDVEKSLRAGMNAHVAKPIDVKVLLQTMHMLAK